MVDSSAIDTGITIHLMIEMMKGGQLKRPLAILTISLIHDQFVMARVGLLCRAGIVVILAAGKYSKL